MSDPGDPFTKALRGTYNELHGEKTAVLAAITDLDKADEGETGRSSVAGFVLLDSLPFLALKPSDAPEALLRRLFEVSHLGVPEIAETAERLTTVLETQETPAQGAGVACVDAVCAPGQIRTDTGRVLNPLPLPLGYGGLLRRCMTLRDGARGFPGGGVGLITRLGRVVGAHTE